ncbi:hypothetical protein C6503_06830 [Candidatus Poribacteria bacterium]|nr:MAG: hypothetical protein C6503_06830 [Candidatus Poribacteria bacterium]
MSILIRVVIINIVGVLTVGLLGCGGIFPSTPVAPNSPNLNRKYENIPHDSILLQAKADAESDASRDANLLAHFGAGMSAPFAAATCGVTGVCLYDMAIGYEENYFPYIGASVGAAVVFSTLIAYYIRPPNPPPERLIGKSPEYVKFYADAYRSKTRSSRMLSVAAGSAFGAAILTGVGFSILSL